MKRPTIIWLVLSDESDWDFDVRHDIRRTQKEAERLASVRRKTAQNPFTDWRAERVRIYPYPLEDSSSSASPMDRKRD